MYKAFKYKELFPHSGCVQIGSESKNMDEARGGGAKEQGVAYTFYMQSDHHNPQHVLFPTREIEPYMQSDRLQQFL